jgi:hypothetical protein
MRACSLVAVVTLLCLLAAAPSRAQEQPQQPQQPEQGSSEGTTLQQALAEIRAVVSNFTAWADTQAAAAANGTDTDGRDVTAQGGDMPSGDTAGEGAGATVPSP